MNKKFYITTAIAYTNAKPHAGHALEIIQADTLARFYRFLGYDVVFQTGTDDHGMKNRNSAKDANIDVKAFVDMNSQAFTDMYKQLDISYDTFIQTSDQTIHYPGAQLMRNKLVEAGDIYKKSYKGLYCVGCEALKLEKDLIDGKCPDHTTTPLQEIEEENYFFRLSKYKDEVSRLIESNEYKIEPEIRKNEILEFLKKADDVSFSRQKSKMPWGIPVPGDEEHVMYVRCDALTNYLTGQGFGRNDDWQTVWPADIHVIGKDILRFHAAFWPAMLISAKLALPKKLLTHGHLTLNGSKMSKSIGNVVDPVEVIAKYGRDPFVFNLLYDVSFTSDGDFSPERLGNIYNSMLIGGRGNLVNRVTSLCAKYEIKTGKYHEASFQARGFETTVFTTGLDTDKLEEVLNQSNIQGYLQDRYRMVQKANEFITKAEPWKKWKEESTKGEAERDLQFLLLLVKNLAILSAPFLTQGFEKIKNILGMPELQAIDTSKTIENDIVKKAFDMNEFTVNLTPEIIYQKVEE